MKTVKVAVLLRYYQCVCRKLHIARTQLDENRIAKLKEIKMKLLFLESPIYKDYAKHGIETIVDI